MDVFNHKYNDSIASHYAAFRPPLHEVILRRLIPHNEYFKVALDVGCGTGCSTIALAEYCDHIIGLDSSQAMLDQAILDPKITYLYGNGDDFSMFEQECFDIVSFAGSLFYLKTNMLKSELQRTLTADGVVVVYDFQVLLDDILASMDITGSDSCYNFVENIKDWPEFTLEFFGTDVVQLNLSAEQITHVLLANSFCYQAFQKIFNEDDPFDSLIDHIEHQDCVTGLKAEIYFSRYRILK